MLCIQEFVGKNTGQKINTFKETISRTLQIHTTN